MQYVTSDVAVNPAAHASPLILQNVFRLVVAAALETFPNATMTDQRHPVAGTAPAVIRRAVAFIEERAADDIDLTDVAEAAHVGPRALQRAFRNALDTTPLGYLRAVRLQRAHDELRVADPADGTTVAAIAARWGFRHPGRFAAEFRRRFGRHPAGLSPGASQDERMTVRWGVVGPGRIASRVVADFPHVPGAEVVAVASRSAERAAAFAAEHGIARTHHCYRAIIDDDGVDVLYIATPHPQHRAVALTALRAGKAVLVEKAFTVTPTATREIAAVAAGTGVFAMEAMWTRFQPAIVAMRERIAGGAIGDVRTVQADLGVRASTDPDDRFYNRAIGGGALFDVGVYPISFAQMVLGTPSTVAAHGLLDAGGVDVEETVLLGCPDGRSASLFASLRCASPGRARVVGTEGWLDVQPRFHHPDTFVVHRVGHEPEYVTVPHLGGGYAHELIEVTECIAAGRGESAVMPLADTVAVQEVMGAVADQLGMVPEEGPAELPGR